MSKSETSKYLSYILRHKPDTIGLTLDGAGWASVDALIAKSEIPISREELEAIVAADKKQRFALSPDGKRIRANQGHSIAVDLGLQPAEPPTWLYHGTATRFVAAIRAEGLKPGARHHVHLSADIETAKAVGRRYGKLHLFRIAAKRLYDAGQLFWRSDNGVWLVTHIAPSDLEEVETEH